MANTSINSKLAGFHHRFVPATNRSPRTLLMLHGTGGDENDLLGLGRRIDPEAALLSPRGNVLEHGAPRFFRRLAEGVFDEADLGQRTDELAAFITSACQTYQRDVHQLIAVGFSNGANIAGAMLYRHADALAAAILIRPMVPFQSIPLPPLDRKPLLLLAGRNDPIVSTEESDRWLRSLLDAGADATLQWTASGHNLVEPDVVAAAHWLTDLKLA